MSSNMIIVLVFVYCTVYESDGLPLPQNNQELQTTLSGKLGIDAGGFPDIDKEDITIPADLRLKYWSLSMQHKHRQKRAKLTLPIFDKVVRENEAFLSDVVQAGSMRHQLTFEMNRKLNEDSKISMAELKLYKERPNHTTHKPHNRTHPLNNARVSIHQIIRAPGNDSTTSLALVDSRLVAVNGSGWRIFDVTLAVQRWLQNPDDEFMLEVWIEGERPTTHALKVAKKVEFATDQIDHHHLPQLVVYTEHYKQRFGPSDCKLDQEDETCCRKSRYINFRNMQWSNRWIIEPVGYDAYECVGPCRISQRGEPTNLVSCDVAKSSSLPMMYLTKKGGVTEIEVANIPNMIVDECRCKA
ncbi:left-right determination factor 2-like [Glandiceps talaboti]